MESKIKFLNSIFIALFLFACVFLLSACDHKHSPKGEYLFNATHHWYQCSEKDCNEKVDFEEHDFSGGVCSQCHYGATASISVGGNTTYFKTLASAIASVNSSTATTIKLQNTSTTGNVVNGSGIVLPENRNITIDLNNCTYLIDAPAVGSSGTTSNGMQLLKNSNITLKNGTISHKTTYTPTADNQDVQILIQNYANLTLDNVILDGRSKAVNAQGTCLYVLSNNFGNVTFKGTTKIICDEERQAGVGGCAFDLWYGMSSVYNDGVFVTFDSTYNGTIDGKIEYGSHSALAGTWEDKAKLTINGGTFTTLDFYFTRTDSSLANIEIKGGTFRFNVSNYVDLDNYTCTQNGTWWIVAEK